MRKPQRPSIASADEHNEEEHGEDEHVKVDDEEINGDDEQLNSDDDDPTVGEHVSASPTAKVRAPPPPGSVVVDIADSR
jgi:hypothetical protein